VLLQNQSLVFKSTYPLYSLPENNAIAPQPEVGDSKDEKHIVHTPEESSSSSDDGYSSDHSNNGDFGLLDSSPFALTQSFFQDTQQ